uniref:Tetratricopeptide repeat protein 27 n=1 Tax=Cacopsylla melanoneura TaxID=428564 RepID=A0A8D8VKE9_9HEMI
MDAQSLVHKKELEFLKFEYPFESVLNEFNANLYQYLKEHVTNDLGQLVTDNKVEEFNKIIAGKNAQEQLQVLKIGISSLNLFIQENWTGPRNAKPSNAQLDLDTVNVDTKKATELLCLDSCIEFSTLPRHPKLLLLAKFVLSANYTHLLSPPWWRLRMLHIHQSLLDENSSLLYNQIESLSQHLVQDPTSILSLHTELKLNFWLELFHVYLTYGVISKIQSVMREINTLADLTMTLKGALGKRTKWQEKNIAQLLLDIKFTESNSEKTNIDTVSNKNEQENTTSSSVELSNTTENLQHNPREGATTTLPHNVKLDDDTRLDTIAYEDAARIPSLSSSQQLIVYANLVYIYRTSPKDGLKLEELRPYIDVLLGQDGQDVGGARLLWGVRYGVLFLRSKLESDHRRTVERSMMQLEELRGSLTKEVPESEMRLELFFMSCIPSANTMESTLANVLVSLGDIKSALTIYESLHHWEEMICCYNLLQLRHLSVEVIREQLAVKETPKLYCLLGDATDEVEHYHTAWKLSGERSARAMKSLGMFHYKKKEYPESIPYFQRSLEINSIQIDLWNRLGYAALQCGDKMDVACSAYNRYVSLEPDDFQGWNNLARAYLDRGEKQRTYNALVEAVRTSNMDNWKVIENLMRVAVDTKHFECALRSYSQLLDIKPKHYDGQVLTILVSAILDMISSTNEQTAPNDQTQLQDSADNDASSENPAKGDQHVQESDQNTDTSVPKNAGETEDDLINVQDIDLNLSEEDESTEQSDPRAPKRDQTPAQSRHLAKSLLTNALRLFGRLTSVILNESELWYLYAQLNQARDNAADALELRKTLKYVTHAHACLMRDERSVKEIEGRRRIGEVCALWSGLVGELAGISPPLGDRRGLLVTARMSLRSSLVGMERQTQVGGEGERDEEVERVRECLGKVEAMLSVS